MYRLFIIIIGHLIFEGANTLFLVESPKNDTKPIGSFIRKLPDKIERSSRFGNKQYGHSNEDSKGNSLESVVLAIDTGVKQFMAGKTKPDIVDNIAKSLVNFAKQKAGPIYRSKGQEYDIKPEIVHFRSDKPSVIFEINSKAIVNVLKDLLQSKTVHKYMDKFSKEAAVIYRTIKHDLEKAKQAKQVQQH